MHSFSHRITDAFDYARVALGSQTRKGSNMPYVYHLLGIASLVIEFGGDEDEAIAGLLHDVVEDYGVEHLAAVRTMFGEKVARILTDCTVGAEHAKERFDSAETKREDWQQRKEQHLAHLEQANEMALLVSACDKLQKARAIVKGLESDEIGTTTFDHLFGEREETLWYYRSLASIFSKRGTPPSEALLETVMHMHALLGDEWPQSIEAGSLRPLPSQRSLHAYRAGMPAEPVNAQPLLPHAAENPAQL